MFLQLFWLNTNCRCCQKYYISMILADETKITNAKHFRNDSPLRFFNGMFFTCSLIPTASALWHKKAFSFLRSFNFFSFGRAIRKKKVQLYKCMTTILQISRRRSHERFYITQAYQLFFVVLHIFTRTVTFYW